VAAGVSRDDLRALLSRGRVRRVLRGAYVDAAVPDSLDLRAAAAATVVPRGHVICLRTAAWLWGVDTLAMGAHLQTPPVDVMAPSLATATRRQGCLARTGPLPDSDVVELLGMPVTTPSRTGADLLRLLRRPDALASIDALLRAGVSRESVADVLGRFARARGVVQARELLSLGDARSESPMESRTRLRCVDGGFPCPEPQIEVFDEYDGALLARLDMGYREVRKAVEFDGDEAHRTPAQLRHDERRRLSVEGQGWQLLVVTSAQVLSPGLTFEHAMAELLGQQPRLSRHHPRHGGWDRRVPGGL
jgi:hypothetical protein